MSRRIPEGAFELYVSLGQDRSFQAVADHYGVSKRAVTKVAARDEWSERLEKIERQAREASDRKLAETLEDMRTRHLKTIRAMQARALSALRQYPLSSGMEAMRAAEMTIKLERLIAGAPTDRSELSVEEVTRREIQTLLVPVGQEKDDGEDGGDGQSNGE